MPIRGLRTSASAGMQGELSTVRRLGRFLTHAPSFPQAAGKMRSEGRSYVVCDGDIIHFKIGQKSK